MKSAIPFLALFIYIISFAPRQKCPFLRVYAYAQPVLQGVSPHGPVEEGNNSSKSMLKTGGIHYLFYAWVRRKSMISPNVLWIKGQGFSVRIDTVSRLPVTISSSVSDGKTSDIILVPATSKTVIGLTPGPLLNFFAPPEPRLQALLDTNELVIEYTWNGETCYFAAGKIKMLEPAAAQ